MNCYETIDLMGEELEGRLPQDARMGFDEHLIECDACRNYFDQLRLTVQALERLPKQPVPIQKRAELIAAFQREWKKAH